ncbi:MAG TPA: winged helix-turn-helix domain-containing protein [Thermoanaerobaculia bacterium]
MPDREIFEFGPYRLEVTEHRLREGDRPIALKPKVFETLVLLVRNAGHLLSKADLMKALWPDAVVDETNLNKNVWLIRRALGGSGDSSEYIETVPRIGYRFTANVRRIVSDRAGAAPSPPPIPTILPVLAAEPAPEPVSGAAEGNVAGARSSLRTRSARGPWIAAASLFLVVIAGIAWWRSARTPGATVPTALRPTISVLGFRNLSNRRDLDWISTALSEMVQTELASGSSYRLMPVETADRLRRELGLEQPGSLSSESLARLRRAAAVDEVVGGSYVSSGPDSTEIRLDVLVQDARTGETIASATETGEAPRLLDMVSSVGARLRLALREPDRRPTAEGARDTLPRDTTTLRLYAEGLRKLRDSDTLAARDLLVAATAAEPDFPLAHAALGRAYATLGYEEKARLELQQAVQNSRGLPRKEQLEIESSYRAASKEWDKAIALCQELERLAPDDLENGLRFASLALNASRRQDALAVIQRLRHLPAPTGTDPRIDLLESRALLGTDPKAALQAADRGLAESRARHERSVEANALLDRAVALQTLGRAEKAPVEEAMRIFTEVGDAGGEARAAHILGNIQFDAGDAEGARASYQHTVDVSDRIGYVLEKAAGVASLSRVASLRGDNAEAERLIVEANSIWRAVPDRRQLPWGLNALGSIRLGQGRLAEAEALHREALQMCRERGDTGSYLHDGYSGLIAGLAAEGRLADATRVAEEALGASREIQDPSWVSQHLAESGLLAFERGRFADADRFFAESLGIRRQKEEYTVPESEVLIAQLRFEQGNREDARRLAAEASRQFAAAGRKNDQAGADALEAEAMLSSGRRDEAWKTIEAAGRLLDEQASAEARIPVLLARARVESALGRAEAARADVGAAARLAGKLAWKNLVLEARLAAVELDAGSGAAAASAAAAAVASGARALGFERIAQRADRLTAQKP